MSEKFTEMTTKELRERINQLAHEDQQETAPKLIVLLLMLLIKTIEETS